MNVIGASASTNKTLVARRDMSYDGSSPQGTNVKVADSHVEGSSEYGAARDGMVIDESYERTCLQG